MNHYLEIVKRAVNNSLYLGTDSPACDDRYYLNSAWTLPRNTVPHSLCNSAQLNFLHRMMSHLHRSSVPGDFLEAGVWRGGACIFMRAFLETVPDNRSVWLLDTFEGIPISVDSKYGEDEVDAWEDRWAAGMQEVKSNFSAYGLLDDRVRFKPGRIRESLANDTAIRQVALARLDVDSYESYTEALEYIVPLVTVGGCIIIDDWHLAPCKAAVLDFRKANGISSPILETFEGQWADAFWIIGS